MVSNEQGMALRRSTAALKEIGAYMQSLVRSVTRILISSISRLRFLYTSYY